MTDFTLAVLVLLWPFLASFPLWLSHRHTKNLEETVNPSADKFFSPQTCWILSIPGIWFMVLALITLVGHFILVKYLAEHWISTKVDRHWPATLLVSLLCAVGEWIVYVSHFFEHKGDYFDLSGGKLAFRFGKKEQNTHLDHIQSIENIKSRYAVVLKDNRSIFIRKRDIRRLVGAAAIEQQLEALSRSL